MTKDSPPKLNQSMEHPIPITVFTGFLGSGKTTTILNLLSQLPTEYRVVLLKNEFGDIEDSQIAKQSSVQAVSEILNGCMCCILVGQLKTALLEIREKFAPDRIIIETSGSAFPATLAFQIRELERETAITTNEHVSTGSGNDPLIEVPKLRQLKLDAIVTVIDAENFLGYEDTSPTARMQASYSDLILINKWEQISERKLDEVMDHIHTLNDLTPKVRTQGKKGISPDLIFGLDSKLFMTPLADGGIHQAGDHNDEVETATLLRDAELMCDVHIHDEHCGHDHDREDESHNHGSGVPISLAKSMVNLTEDVLSTALSKLPKEDIYRVKGFVRIWPTTSVTGGGGIQDGKGKGEVYILNWAFGRFDLTPVVNERDEDGERMIKLTIMGARGEVKKWARRLAEALEATVA